MSPRNTKHLIAALAIAAAPLSAARGDPFPYQDLKFQQRPMTGTQIVDGNGVLTTYYGHDERSTARFNTATGRYEGTFMADDFADKVDTDVFHVTWWGSYLINPVLPTPVQKFLIAWETDIPQQPGVTFSRPGTVIQSEIVTRGALAPGSGTFTETLEQPVPNGEHIYRYNAELHMPFDQQKDKVYWLKIVALADNPNETFDWGWHNRDYTQFDPFASGAVSPGEHDQRTLTNPNYPVPVWHFQDDAVTGQVQIGTNAQGQLVVFQEPGFIQPTHYIDGVDGPGPGLGLFGQTHNGVGVFSKDLAFELYTIPIPEPASIALLALGAVCVLRRDRLCST